MPRRCADDLWSVDVESPAEAEALATELRRAGTWLVGASVPLSQGFKEGLKDPTITLKRCFYK